MPVPCPSTIVINLISINQLGAGTALPSLLLFRLLLCSKPSPIPVRRSFWLADYNPSVLRLATIPNLLLTYALTANPVPLASGDLEMTHSFLTSFHEFLADRNIYIRTAAGNWGPRLAALMTPPSDPYPAETLILASETIYSPESTLAFTVCLDETMRRCEESGCRVRALIAAKKVYFGVGGGVDEFLGALKERGSEGNVVWETEGMGRGVGRCILEVTRGTQ